MDEYLEAKGLWRRSRKPGEWDWKKFYACLLARKLTIADIEQLTMPEALLYTVPTEPGASNDSAVAEAFTRANIMYKVGVEDYLNLALLRTRGTC